MGDTGVHGRAAGGGVDRREPPAVRARRDRRDRRLIALAALGIVLIVFWLLPLRGGTPSGTDAGRTAPPADPGPPPPEVTAPARLTPAPRAGSVTLQPGPFDARVGLSGLVFTKTPSTGVSGSARLLGAEQGTATIGLRVDFYDATGTRVGTAVQVLRQPAAFARDPSGARRPFPFAITAKEPLPNAIAARIAVTTLAVS
jgi:hypothetical protein